MAAKTVTKKRVSMAKGGGGVLHGALREMQRAERELSAQLASVRQVIRALESDAPRGGTTRKKRNMSAAGREAIARAARKRWAAYRAKKRRGAK